MRNPIYTIAIATVSLFFLFECSPASAQRFKKKKPETLYARNKHKNTTPIYVGIGTSSPTTQFHTTGTVRFQGLKLNNSLTNVVVMDADGNLFYKDFTNSSGNGWLLTGNTPTSAQFLGTTNSEDIRFRTNNIQRMVLSSSGQLGLGVNTPSAQLHTNGSVRFEGITADNTLSKLAVVDNNGNLFFRDVANLQSNFWGLTGNSGTNPSNNFLGTSDNVRLAFRTNNTEKMTLSANGRLGIGTNNPLVQLHVTNSPGAFTNFPYESAVFEKSGDSKIAVLSSDNTGTGGASITLGHSNFLQGSVYPGYEIQYGFNTQRYLRFNYLPRNVNGAIQNESANILIMTDNNRVGINLGPTGGGSTPNFPTANFHTNGTVRMQGLGNGTGNPLVVDANGNVSIGAAQNSWLLTGNAGTNPANNFLGTTDNVRLVVRTNNIERLTVLPDGKVGINNNNPQSQLVVTNNLTEDHHLKVEGLAPSIVFEGNPGPLQAGRIGYATINGNYVAGSIPGDIIVQTLGAANNVIFGVGGGGTGNGFERMRINPNGFVGIATSSPTAVLHTVGTVRLQGLAAGSGNPLVADANGNLFIGNPSTQSNAWNLTGNSGTNPSVNFLGTTDNARVVFRTNNVERMTILPDGKTGIGTSTPTSPLEVYGTTPDNHLRVTGITPSIVLESNVGPNIAGRIGFATINNNFVTGSVPGDMIVQTLGATSSLIFGTTGGGTGNGVERGRFTAVGYFGIATQNPTAKLHVNCAPVSGQTNPSNIRFENITSGTGSALVVDANGYVYKSNTLTGRSQTEEDLVRQIDQLKKEIADLKAAFNEVKKSCSLYVDRPSNTNSKSSD
jgi:hypothetical protein